MSRQVLLLFFYAISFYITIVAANYKDCCYWSYFPKYFGLGSKMGGVCLLGECSPTCGIKTLQASLFANAIGRWRTLKPKVVWHLLLLQGFFKRFHEDKENTCRNKYLKIPTIYPQYICRWEHPAKALLSLFFFNTYKGGNGKFIVGFCWVGINYFK